MSGRRRAEDRVVNRTAAVRGRIGYSIRRWRSGLLITSGAACFSASAYVMHLAAGLAVTGLSLLVLEWCSREAK